MELSRNFYVTDHFQLMPALYVNAGSQNYYNEYYQNNPWDRGKGKRKKQHTPLSAGVASVQEASKFQILDVELSLPLKYKLTHFSVTFTPTLAIPQNPARIIIDQNSYEEELDNTFFWTVAVSYKFFTD